MNTTPEVPFSNKVANLSFWYIHISEGVKVAKCTATPLIWLGPAPVASERDSVSAVKINNVRQTREESLKTYYDTIPQDATQKEKHWRKFLQFNKEFASYRSTILEMMKKYDCMRYGHSGRTMEVKHRTVPSSSDALLI